MASSVKGDLPPSFYSSSDPPAIFDATTELYISYICPYAQRVWMARNYKGLQEKIKLVANRPAWFKEKVYPLNKEINKIEAYTTTKCDPNEFVPMYQRSFLSEP